MVVCDGNSPDGVNRIVYALLIYQSIFLKLYFVLPVLYVSIISLAWANVFSVVTLTLNKSICYLDANLVESC